MHGGAISGGAIQAFIGYSNGVQASYFSGAVEEVRQGKNYYISALAQGYQFQSCVNLSIELVSLFSSVALQNTVYAVCVIGQLLILPVSLLCAAVKQGHYERLASMINEIEALIGMPEWIGLPETLGFYSKQVCCFFAEHGSTILEWASVALAVAIIVCGNPYFGVACLAAVGYGILDRRGYINRRVSLFMETYMPIVSLAGLAITGTIVSRVFSIVLLPFFVFPGVSMYLQHKIDYIARKYFGVEGSSLEEIEAPWEEKKNLSFDQMQEILHADDSQYIVNEAHCTKSVIELSTMPTSLEFDKFLNLFEKINWEEKYELIKRKLVDDERFVYFLQETILAEKTFLADDCIVVYNKKKSLREAILDKKNGASLVKEHIDTCLQALAQIKKQTKEKYAAAWMKEQIVGLVNTLKGDARVKGKQQDLEDAREQLKYVLPSLESLLAPDSITALEDSLMKLALEGGEYCALGVKRASRELLSEAMNRVTNVSGDARQDYEFSLKKNLQERRYLILQRFYNDLVKKMQHTEEEPLREGDQDNNRGLVNDLVANLAFDQHTFDLYRQYLVFGFYPMTSYERFNFSTVEFIMWEVAWRAFRPTFIAEYQNEVSISERGEQKTSYFGDVFDNAGGNTSCLDYLRGIWAEKLQTEQITENEHDELLEFSISGFASKAGASDTTQENKRICKVNKALNRLVLVTLGVLKPVSGT